MKYIILAILSVLMVGCKEQKVAPRFVVLNDQYLGKGIEVGIIVDRETGIKYLFWERGFGGGICKLETTKESK